MKNLEMQLPASSSLSFNKSELRVIRDLADIFVSC